MSKSLKIGISACLLGENVRWNGDHKMDSYLVKTLGQYVTYVPVCPEVECGLGVPRETLRLVGDFENPRLVTTRTKIDHTGRMKTWAKIRVKGLEEENLCGFIFKKDSPSSGLLRVKVYSEKGPPQKKGVGLFAKAFTDHFPRIPVEEEGRLHDPKLRENFIEQIFTLKRWRDVLTRQKKVGKLADFHTRHKLTLMSHSPKHYQMMGRLVAGSKKQNIEEAYDQYELLLLEALTLKSTVKKNINVLQCILGYFKTQLTAHEKEEMLEIIENYRNTDVPLIVPITMLKHYVRKYKQPYLEKQIYLNPHPLHLQLRTHA
jgi:uncharacterized protein YbgA (DUF1722 family)/uncharacterized protein YbbK (DUF523 family)